MTPEHAYQVPCPKCKARKGDRCKDMRSPDWHFQLDTPKRAHRERVELSRKAQEKEQP